jgi:hypothetical protein
MRRHWPLVLILGGGALLFWYGVERDLADCHGRLDDHAGIMHMMSEGNGDSLRLHQIARVQIDDLEKADAGLRKELVDLKKREKDIQEFCVLLQSENDALARRVVVLETERVKPVEIPRIPPQNLPTREEPPLKRQEDRP